MQALEFQDDPTARLLYSIAQRVRADEIKKEDQTVDVLVDPVERQTNNSSESMTFYKVLITLFVK